MNIKRTCGSVPTKCPQPMAASSAEEKPVTRTDSELRAENKKEDLYTGLAFVASGAIGGAVGGAWGNNTLGRTLATAATTAATDTATLVAVDKITNPFLHFGLIMGPPMGVATGAASGLLGSAITSVTGLNAVASGAIAGGLTHAALLAGVSAFN